MTRVDPNLWQIPQWHADWDGEFQFAGLRTFAKALQDGTDLDTTLSIIEEGYARLEVFDSAMRIGLVYWSVAPPSRSRLSSSYAARSSRDRPGIRPITSSHSSTWSP